MAVGTILTLDQSGRVIHRKPVWPWPAPSEYHKEFFDGTTSVFRPIPYYHFPLREPLKELV